MNRKLIGIDIGTQGTKAALFGEDGRCLSVAFAASNLRMAAGGLVEEDPEKQYESVLATIGECVRKSGTTPADIVGLAIAGQMAGIIGVGADGRHITPYDSWLDTRCTPFIARMKEIAGHKVLAKTGCAPSFNHGPKILWWRHEHPEIYHKVHAFVQPAGYAAMRLCGLAGAGAFIDKTYLHFSGFADIDKAQWDQGLCRLFDISSEKLPRIVDSATLVGTVDNAGAAACGLRPGTPVAAGCGDSSASFLASGPLAQGVAVDIAGTASVFAATTIAFRPDLKQQMLACSRSVVEGLWHSYGYINGGGMNVAWFRDKIAPGVPAERGVSFDELNAAAEAVSPNEDAPIFIPHLSGRACPGQPDLRGGWIGVGWDHSPADMYRAVLEGVALEYGLYQKSINKLNPHLDMREVRVMGGGEYSRVWNQIKADVLGVPVVQAARSEGAPLGAAIVAGVATGVLEGYEAAGRWVAPGVVTHPRPEFFAYYQRRLCRYEAMLEALNAALEKDTEGLTYAE